MKGHQLSLSKLKRRGMGRRGGGGSDDRGAPGRDGVAGQGGVGGGDKTTRVANIILLLSQTM